jgi:tetratricopeptide (TPR) repeat protein
MSYVQKPILGKLYNIKEGEFTIHENKVHPFFPTCPDATYIEKLGALINEINPKILLDKYPSHGGYLYDQLSSEIQIYSSNEFEHERALDMLELSLDYPKDETFTKYKFTTPKVFPKVHYIFIESPTEEFRKINHNGYQSYEFWDDILLVHHKSNEDFVSLFPKPDRIKTYDNLLHLVMIVKNSGELLEKMLMAVRPHIDKWTIVDTGSTDNTMDIVRRVMTYPSGQLLERPFDNFRDSRNHSLEMAGKSCVFNMVLDDSYILNGGDVLRQYLTEMRHTNFPTEVNINLQSNTCRYDSCRISRSRLGRRYKYRVHEVIDGDPVVYKIAPEEGVFIWDEHRDYLKDRTMARMKRDLVHLKLDQKDEPNNPRHLFYIAQTYFGLGNYEKSFKYYTKRAISPDEGTKEEVYTALFRRAQIAELYLKRQWDECLNLNLQAYNERPHRAEPLCIIMNYYMRAKKYHMAYLYAHRAMEIPFPIDEGLFVEKDHYHFHIPNMVAELCVYFNNNALGIEATMRAIAGWNAGYRDPADPNRISILEEFKFIFEYKLALETRKSDYGIIPFKSESKKRLVITTMGNFYPWNGETLREKGLGGTETSIVRFAEELSEYYDVHVFCNTISRDGDKITEDKSGTFYGVQYHDIADLFNYVVIHQIDTMIILRSSIYLAITNLSHIHNVYIWLEDLTFQSKTLLFSKNFRGVFYLTEFHRQINLQQYPSIRRYKNYITTNCVDMDAYIEKYGNVQPVHNKFIYSSFPDRGLIHTLRLMKSIYEKYPDASLDVFCNLDLEIFKNNAMIDEIKGMIEEMPYVVNHGWVDKDTLYNYWSKAEYWLYPSIFPETSCITSMECAMSKTLAITNDLGALAENVGDRGIMINGNPNEEGWYSVALNEIFLIMEDPKRRDELTMKNFEWVKSRNYPDITKSWVEIFNSNGQLSDGLPSLVDSNAEKIQKRMQGLDI